MRLAPGSEQRWSPRCWAWQETAERFRFGPQAERNCQARVEDLLGGLWLGRSAAWSSGRSTSLLLTKVAPARTSAIRWGALTMRHRRSADSISLKAMARAAASVRLVRETGKPIAQVARDLGINEGHPGQLGER